MRTFVKLIVITVAFSCSFAFAAETDELANAYRDQRMLEQDVALALAPIKSKNELDAYVESTPAALSPLSKLSPPARERFLASITFNEKGITGFRHDDLQVELSPSEIYRVLSLFGAQHTTALFKRARSETPADAAIMEPLMQTAPQSGPLCPSQPCDYDGYMCESRATCAPNINTICMRNC